MNRLAEIIAHKRTEIEPLNAHTAEWQERARKLSSFRFGFTHWFSRDLRRIFDWRFIGEKWL
jgi:hypothetical protein